MNLIIFTLFIICFLLAIIHINSNKTSIEEIIALYVFELLAADDNAVQAKLAKMRFKRSSGNELHKTPCQGEFAGKIRSLLQVDSYVPEEDSEEQIYYKIVGGTYIEYTRMEDESSIMNAYCIPKYEEISKLIEQDNSLKTKRYQSIDCKKLTEEVLLRSMDSRSKIIKKKNTEELSDYTLLICTAKSEHVASIKQNKNTKHIITIVTLNTSNM